MRKRLRLTAMIVSCQLPKQPVVDAMTEITPPRRRSSGASLLDPIRQARQRAYRRPRLMRGPSKGSQGRPASVFFEEFSTFHATIEH
jgi:hypothetical protein